MIPNEPRLVKQINPLTELIRFRASGLTGKDAATLYGLTIGRSLEDMWTDKVGVADTSEDDSNQDDMFILPARMRFEAKISATKSRALRDFFCINKVMPFIRAELNAADIDDKVFAVIVQQSKTVHDFTDDASLSVRGGRVPERYWIEIQHGLIASGFNRAFFVSTIDGTQISYVEVPEDPIFQSNHTAECITFWDYVRRSVRPPGLPPEAAPEAVDPAQTLMDLDNVGREGGVA